MGKATEHFKLHNKRSTFDNATLMTTTYSGVLGQEVPKGMLVYDTDEGVLKYGDGTSTLRLISYT